MPRGRTKLIYNSGPGGIRSDLNPATIPDGQWLSSSNWLVRNGVGVPRPGYSQLGSTLAAADEVTGIFVPGTRAFYDNESPMIVHTKTKAYRYVSGTYTDITGSWTSSPYPARMIYYMSGGAPYILRANSSNAIDSNDWTASAFANIAAAPACADLCAVGPYVLATDNYGVKWNAANDMTTWPSSNVIKFQETGGGLGSVVAVRSLNAQTAVAMSSCGLWLCTLQAAKTAFRSVYYGEIAGPSHAGHVCQFNGKLYWIGPDFALWEFDGSSVRQLISGNAETFRVLQSGTYAMQPNSRGSSVVVPLPEPEAWFFFSGAVSSKFCVSYNLKTLAATHHTLQHEICSAAVGSLGTNEDERRVILGDSAGKVFVMAPSTLTDDGTDIPWSFEYGYRPLADIDDRGRLDGVASYFKKTSSSCTVTVGVALSDGIDGSESYTTDTFDTNTAGNHLKTFRSLAPKKWLKLKYSGTKAVDDLEHRGSIVTCWERSMV